MAPSLPIACRRQYAAFGLVAAGTVALTAIQSRTDPAVFGPYLLGLPPLLAVTLVVLAAALALRILLPLGVRVWRPAASGSGLAVAALGGTLLVLPTVVVDLSVGFPRAINVPPPAALLFYPVIGFVAEVVFHLVPLAVLAGLALAAGHGRRPVFSVTGVVLVATLEPVFQVFLADAHHQAPWLTAYVGVHLWLFNAFQLWLFRRYDLLTLYTCRLVYYLHWHLLWGVLRLHLLF
jgi:hypothetical protein